MAEFASKGVAGAGLGLGIAGTALGLLNGTGSLVGGCGWGNGAWGRGGYSVGVNDAQQDIITGLASEVSFYRAKSYSDETGLEMYKYVDGRLRELENRMHQNEVAQTAFNSTTTASLNTMAQQINEARATLAMITRTAVPESVICDFQGRNCNCGTVSQ